MSRLLPLLLRRPWLTAAALAFGLHALWLFGLPAPADRPPGATPPAGPTVRYEAVRSWRALQRQRRGDPRLLNSPALFALPTPLGFSGSELDREIRHAPRIMDPPPVAAATSVPTRITVPEQELARWQRPETGRVDLVLDRPPVFAGRPAGQGASLQARWSADFTGAVARLLPATDAVWTDAVPWEVTAAVRYDEHGFLREVFLDPPGPRPDRNAAAVRLLRSLPMPPGGAGQAGRVILRYRTPARESAS